MSQHLLGCAGNVLILAAKAGLFLLDNIRFDLGDVWSFNEGEFDKSNIYY